MKARLAFLAAALGTFSALPLFVSPQVSWQPVFEDIEWYRDLEATEQTFVGHLAYVPRYRGGITTPELGRLSALTYSLSTGNEIYWAYVPNAQVDATLKSFVGRQVQVKGKIFQASIPGTPDEVWIGEIRAL